MSDLYADIRALISRLTDAGDSDLARALEEAMYGATSGEILTLVAHILDRTLREGTAQPEHQEAIEALFDRVRRALAAVGQRKA